MTWVTHPFITPLCWLTVLDLAVVYGTVFALLAVGAIAWARWGPR